MTCMITKQLLKVKKIKDLNSVKISVLRRYLRIKIAIDIEPVGLKRRIEMLERDILFN